MRALVVLVLFTAIPASAQQRRSFADTLGPGHRFKARSFDLTKPRVRDSLRTVLADNRNAWRATGIRDYQVTVRSACFCPGENGWMVLEARDGKLARAANEKGKKLPISKDVDYTIDRLFEILDINALRDDEVEVAFDSARHFPTYIRSDYRHGLPDDWWILDVRNLVVTKGARPR